MDPRTKCGKPFSSPVNALQSLYMQIFKNWSDRLTASSTFCGSRPTRAEVCRTPLASLVDSPDPLEVRRGGGNGRERVSKGKGETLNGTCAAHEREKERKQKEESVIE